MNKFAEARMKFRRALVPLLFFAFCGPGQAQTQQTRGSDPIVRSTADALRAGRVTDAEKILTDAIHDLEQSEPQSPRLANYLQRLANVEARLGRTSRSRRAKSTGLCNRSGRVRAVGFAAHA